MNNAWPKVRLGDVLRRVERFEPRDELTEYPFAGTYSFARGIFVGERKLGSTFALPKIQRVREGDFIYCKIMAWEGAFGIAPKEVDNCVMSGAFVVYEVNRDRIDQKFLDYFLKVPAHWQAIGSQSSGTNVRRQSLHPSQFEHAEIPLPPLAEQRRIVAYIEALAAKIAEARSLRQQTVEEAEALLRSILTHDTQAKMTPMRELVRLRLPDVTVRADESYQFAGVYCFGRGVFKTARKSGLDFAYPRLTRLRVGEFVYPKLMAWEGALGIVPPECNGCVVSTEFPVFEVLEDRVVPEVLDTYFRTPSVWPKLSGASTGTNVRRRRLNPQDFLSYEIPLPTRETQMTLRKVRAEVDALRRLQTETSAELDALLPAILHRAFKGELLSVEPVSVVLPTAAVAPPTQHSRGIFFRRAAIDAYIVNALQDDKNLGRTKLEKISHLLEYHCGVDLEREPLRDAAGPIDNVSRRKVESLAVKQRWYSVQETREHWGMRVSYAPGPKIADALAYAKKTLGAAHHSSVGGLIALLRPLDTKQSEIIATLYAAWNDLLLAGKNPADDEIVAEVRERWHPSKQKISVDRWEKGLHWLRQSGLVPRGTGKPVRHARG